MSRCSGLQRLDVVGISEEEGISDDNEQEGEGDEC